MTSYLLAGGGTAGHVNPMLAMADELRRRDPAAQIVCVGTVEGLESTLVPARGFELVTIPRIPFPRIRGLVSSSKRFIAGWPQAVKTISQLITDRHVDVVIGVGGYSAAPAYAAARKAGIPFVIHEANAKPGLANRWGALRTPYVGVTFEGTPLPHATTVGTPLRKEIETLDIPAARSAAREHFGLEVHRPVLVVTSGSQGARSINTTIAESAADIVAAGYQVLHIVGQNKPEALPSLPGYIALDYCDRMDLALAAANMVVSRAGSATVSELSALGVPAVYVPYPVGNGEQRFNVEALVASGGGILVADADFDAAWVRNQLVPLVSDSRGLSKYAAAAREHGIADGTARLFALVQGVLPPKN